MLWALSKSSAYLLEPGHNFSRASANIRTLLQNASSGLLNALMVWKHFPACQTSRCGCPASTGSGDGALGQLMVLR